MRLCDSRTSTCTSRSRASAPPGRASVHVTGTLLPFMSLLEKLHSIRPKHSCRVNRKAE